MLFRMFAGDVTHRDSRFGETQAGDRQTGWRTAWCRRSSWPPGRLAEHTAMPPALFCSHVTEATRRLIAERDEDTPRT
jgi:hypothetical protein